MLKEAIQYHRAGLKVIPVYQTKSGEVQFPHWKHWSEGAEQTEGDIRRLFSTPCWGLAILCTDGMEVIDIDIKQDPFGNIDKEYFEEVFWSTGDEDLLPALTTVRTKSGGFHLIYRCESVEGNRKLCKRTDSKEAVIETRGIGGIIFAAPTPGYSVLRNSYEDIATISVEQRSYLIGSAVRLSDVELVEDEPKVRREQKKVISRDSDLTPWDDFNEQTDVRDIIERHGWTPTGRDNSRFYYYTKPGGTKGNVHGTVSKDRGIFVPFTTGTDFEDQRGYTPYSALAILEHDSDFSGCAKELLRLGYGFQPESAQPKKTEEQKAAEDELMAFVRGTRFDIDNPPKEEEATLMVEVDGKVYKVGGPGMIGGIVGKQKSAKSTFNGAIVSSTLGGGNQVLNLTLENRGGRKLYFDTEQSRFFYGVTQKRIYEMAGLRQNPWNYEAYHLRRLTVDQRIKAIDQLVMKAGDIELIVIDGLLDICTNYNDETAAARTIEKLMHWSDESGAMLISILHLTKGMGFMMGHLGSAFARKVDFAFECEKDRETNLFTAKCRESRFAPFPRFDFERDERGFPRLVGSVSDNIEPDYPEPAAALSMQMTVRGDDDDTIPF